MITESNKSCALNLKILSDAECICACVTGGCDGIRAVPSNDFGEDLDVRVDDLLSRDVGISGIPGGRLHDNEPVLEVTAIEAGGREDVVVGRKATVIGREVITVVVVEDRLPGRPAIPVRRRVPSRGRDRLRREEPGGHGHGRGWAQRCREEAPYRRGKRSVDASTAASSYAAEERSDLGESERARRRRRYGGKS